MKSQNQPVNVIVGRSLWWVGSKWTARNNEPTQYEVTVTKVGRKWALLSNGERIDTKTLTAEGGKYMHPPQCYESQQVYEQTMALHLAWQKFTNDVQSMSLPAHMTREKIHEIYRMLKPDYIGT